MPCCNAATYVWATTSHSIYVNFCYLLLVELCFGTLLFLICFFWGFTALNGVVFQVVTSNQQNIKKSIMITIISAFDMVDSRWYLRFKLLFMVYFSIWASKTLQKSSAIQKTSVTLSSVIIAIIVCKLLIFSTLKLQQFSLITKFLDTYISSNSR